MFQHKSKYKPNQFIPKSNNEQPNQKKNDVKLSYDEIRKLVEHESEKEISRKNQGKQIKHKFDIV